MFSVCIVLYKNADVLPRMLDSLIPFLRSNDEILVHDNYPQSEDWLIVQQISMRSDIPIRYLKSDVNLGFGAACNVLAQHACNERLIFINPDTIVRKFERIVHSPGTILGPFVYQMNGVRQSSSGSSRTVRDEIKMRWMRRYQFHLDKDPVAYVSGVALSIDTSMFLQLGGFDEIFFMYYEDVDLCMRAKNWGSKVEVTSSWVISHVGGSSAKKIRLESEKRSYVSSLRFHKKWNHAWRNYVLMSVVDALARIFYYLLRRDLHSVAQQIHLAIFILKFRDEPPAPNLIGQERRPNERE